jgi:threonine 3-dehydrogenase
MKPSPESDAHPARPQESPHTAAPRRKEPATCRAVVFHAVDQPLQIQEFPVPTPEAGEALIEVECCTLCGSDLHTLSGARQEKSPSILGHEILGRVVALGSPPPLDLSGRPLLAGDRVTWATPVACGVCDRCHRGWPQKCRRLSKYGHEVAQGRQALSGGLAEIVLLRAGSAVMRVPETLPAHVICPANCATATVAAAYRQLGDIAGRKVLIFGAGLLGLTAAAFAAAHGAACVAVTDVAPTRLRHARHFGAHLLSVWPGNVAALRTAWLTAGANLPGTDVLGADRAFDLVLELSGAAEAVEAAVALADIGGRVALVGSVMKSRAVALDPEALVRRCVTLIGVHNYIPEDLQTAVEFLVQWGEHFPFAGLVEHDFPLTAIDQAVEVARRERPVRIAITPGREQAV